MRYCEYSFTEAYLQYCERRAEREQRWQQQQQQQMQQQAGSTQQQQQQQPEVNPEVQARILAALSVLHKDRKKDKRGKDKKDKVRVALVPNHERLCISLPCQCLCSSIRE